MSEKNRDDKNRWRNVTIAFRTFISNGADGYGSTTGNRKGGVSQCQKRIETIKTGGGM